MSVTVSAKLVKDVAEIKVLLQHVSEDGQRQDPKTLKLIPPDFVQQLVVKAEDRVLVAADLGGGLAHNPYFLFKAKGLKPGARIVVEWASSKDVVAKDGRKETKTDKGVAETTLQG